jgi:hypothetical protein
MKDTDEKYPTFEGKYRHESEDADSNFRWNNLKCIRGFTTQQRRLEYASVQFELDDLEKQKRFKDIKRARQSVQDDESKKGINETKDETAFHFYFCDLYCYGKRIRHVMQELDGDILGIEIEQRERVCGVLAPGGKQ